MITVYIYNRDDGSFYHGCIGNVGNITDVNWGDFTGASEIQLDSISGLNFAKYLNGINKSRDDDTIYVVMEYFYFT